MKKLIFILLLNFCCTHSVNSQTNLNNSYKFLSYEFGKTGLIHNLTFDNKIKNKNFGYKLSIGTNFGSYITLGTYSIGSYYLLGKLNHKFEIDIDINKLILMTKLDWAI